MAEPSVVRRYARALFQIATRSNSVDEVEKDLRLVDLALRGSPGYLRSLKAPNISGFHKIAIFKKAFGSEISALSLRFLDLLVERRREDVLHDIYAEFRAMANASRNILPVEVRAAVDLTPAELEALAAALSRRTGKQVVVELEIQPELMGGIVVRMGDTVIDGSIRGRLTQLRNHLLSNRGSAA